MSPIGSVTSPVSHAVVPTIRHRERLADPDPSEERCYWHADPARLRSIHRDPECRATKQASSKVASLE